MKKILFISLFVLCGAGLVAASVPTLGWDSNGGRVFEESGNKWVLWGIEGDVWQCQAGNTSKFWDHCAATSYINANCIVIPVTWKMIEPTMNNYSYWFFDIYLNHAQSWGLKAIVMWVGLGYAGGDSEFCPDYILNDTTTYNRITGLDNSNPLCASDNDTLNREKTAFYNLMGHLSSQNTVLDNIVMAVNIGNEMDYMKALDTYYWIPGNEDHSRRCTCTDCNASYAGQDNVEFMVGQFGSYLAEVIDYGATAYDIPMYSPVAAHKYWAGWRYAEQPANYKWYVDQKQNISNYFVCPSVAEVSSANTFVNDEMDYFTPSQIWGNIIFADGIDTEWSQNQGHMELAPWYSILWYGGLGACYWDSPNKSVITDATLRNKLRKQWGPLLGMHYFLARHKTQGTGAKFWWQYSDTHTWQSMTNFAVDQQSSSSDYGVCLQLGPTDITFAGSTYGGSYTFTVAYSGGWNGFSFERGYYDLQDGTWYKDSDVYPTINGNNAVITVTSDSGVYSNIVYRYHK